MGSAQLESGFVLFGLQLCGLSGESGEGVKGKLYHDSLVGLALVCFAVLPLSVYMLSEGLRVGAGLLVLFGAVFIISCAICIVWGLALLLKMWRGELVSEVVTPVEDATTIVPVRIPAGAVRVWVRITRRADRFGGELFIEGVQASPESIRFTRGLLGKSSYKRQRIKSFTIPANPADADARVVLKVSSTPSLLDLFDFWPPLMEVTVQRLHASKQ